MHREELPGRTGRSYRLKAFRDGYDPGVRRSGLARVGGADIWHAVRAAFRIFFVREFVQAVPYLLGGSGEEACGLSGLTA